MIRSYLNIPWLIIRIGILSMSVCLCLSVVFVKPMIGSIRLGLLGNVPVFCVSQSESSFLAAITFLLSSFYRDQTLHYSLWGSTVMLNVSHQLDIAVCLVTRAPWLFLSPVRVSHCDLTWPDQRKNKLWRVNGHWSASLAGLSKDELNQETCWTVIVMWVSDIRVNWSVRRFLIKHTSSR